MGAKYTLFKLCLFVILLILTLAMLKSAEKPKQTLIASFDCTKDYPADVYFSHGETWIKESAAGRYREAEALPLARFGYRFAAKQINKPHLVVVRYPDDKRRYMCMMDGTTYDLTLGVFTDVSQPLSNKMVEIKKIFWPRWQDCSIVFMTWSTGEPTAVGDIKIYQLEDLPALNVTGDPGDGTHRDFGIQFEDPCSTGGSLGAMTNEDWLEKIVTYMRYSGQNLLTYPIIWYHGPLYPSEREPVGCFDWVAARDRKMYVRWTSRPADWVAQLLTRFQQEGLEFQASMTLLRLGTLMQNMNIDLDSIKSGKETYNNMLWNDHVQSSTRDWTMEYNVLNYEKKINATLKGWAYGEVGGPFPQGPMFNPLHPTVQKTVLGIIQEIADRYSRFSSFKGISINMWHATIAWFFSLRSGYDDYTMDLFEKETGIIIPVDRTAADRFSKRFAFLNQQEHLDRWVDWRCAKIHQLFRAMRDRIVAARPDLRLTVTLWTETTLPGWVGVPDKPSQQIFARKSLYQLCREGGFDVNLYRNEPGIEIDYSFVHSRDRDGWGTNGVDMPLEKTCSLRDHDFLDEVTLQAISSQEFPGAFLFDSWVEAWGKHSWFPCEPNDPQAKEFAVLWGKPTDGIGRMNSVYPKDGFWWDSQLRITPPFQGGIHYMEYIAHSLAELDACRITRGGLFMDTAHTGMIQDFVKAYRALPAKKFTTVGSFTDPIAVRTLVLAGYRYLYLINREYYPVRVELRLKQKPKQVLDLVTLQPVKAQTNWTITLNPYQLCSYKMSADDEILGFTTIAPAQMTDQLGQDYRTTLAQIVKLRSAKIELPIGTEKLVTDIKTALTEGRLAWARRALTSYPIRKCAEMSSATIGK